MTQAKREEVIKRIREKLIPEIVEYGRNPIKRTSTLTAKIEKLILSELEVHEKEIRREIEYPKTFKEKDG